MNLSTAARSSRLLLVKSWLARPWVDTTAATSLAPIDVSMNFFAAARTKVVFCALVWNPSRKIR